MQYVSSTYLRIFQEELQMINKIFQEDFTVNSSFVVNSLKITTVLYLTIGRGPLGWTITISSDPRPILH
jgi:hypothetical protein